MARKLKCELGTLNLLASNPRTIRDDAFNRLCESVERDPEFLMARGVVVWQVPEILAVAEGEKSPFAGQEGQLVVIGGNQRCRAFIALGKENLEKGWVVEAKDADGNWWSPEKAERFVLIDNNPSGIAGQDDTKKMFEKFSELSMRMAGIDFSAFQDRLTETSRKSVEDKIEEGDHGEKSPELKEFIAHREETRKNLEQIDDTGFYIVVCFASREEKVEFISKSGLTGNAGRAMVDDDFYVVLVFETYEQKMEFAVRIRRIFRKRFQTAARLFRKTRHKLPPQLNLSRQRHRQPPLQPPRRHHPFHLPLVLPRQRRLPPIQHQRQPPQANPHKHLQVRLLRRFRLRTRPLLTVSKKWALLQS